MDSAPDISTAEQPSSADQHGVAVCAGFPTAVELALNALAAAAVFALAYASVASGAAIPFLWGVDLAFHEFGHFATFWAPWRVTAAAGSVFQVAVPLGFASYAYFARRNSAATAVLLAWTGCSARNVAVYIADAPYQRLVLWGGDGALHDWAQLLAGRQMQYAGALASAVEVLGWLLIVAGFLIAVAPLALRVAVELSRRQREAAFEARRDSLPVREPHEPLG